ncbi:MAG: hypothetical protein EOO28_27765 [Comamonadaceae bacterium]|nr:MAG: hypothetical protein EOO28_27765 [Comamonadaceae bacterium]
MNNTAAKVRDTAMHATGEIQHSTERALASTRSYANDALDQAESKVRELRGNVDPMVDMLASKAQQLARQSLDLAAEAKDRAQQSLTRYANVTSRYVSEQPMRSVLIAAAVGATVALLVAAARKQEKNRY